METRRTINSPATPTCTQGLLLITVGFITYFARLKLALALATESVLLILANRYMLSRILQLGGIHHGPAGGRLVRIQHGTFSVCADLIMGSFIGAAMISNAAFSLPKERLLNPNDSVYGPRLNRLVCDHLGTNGKPMAGPGPGHGEPRLRDCLPAAS